MNEKNAKTIDKETIFICALMAIAGALGIVVGILAFLGWTIENCDGALLASFIFGVSGILWGILLIFNLGK